MSSAAAPSPAASSRQLVVLGSANADLYVMLDRLPFPGETIGSKSGSGEVRVGGKGVNQAVAAQLAGSSDAAPVHFVGNFGDDGYQTLIRDALRASGVDDSLSAEVPNCSTGIALILLQKQGENSIILIGGSNQTHWDRVLQLASPPHSHHPNQDADEEQEQLGDLLRRAELLMLQCEIPFPANLAAARFAAAHNTKVLLDLGGFNADAFDVDILQHLRLLSANETEFASLARLILRDDSVPESVTTDEALVLVKKLVDQLQAQNLPQYILLTLGSKGSLVVRRRPESNQFEYTLQSCFPLAEDEQIEDTTGAGDCYRGVFAAEYARQPDNLFHCLDASAAAASLCIQAMGAMPSYPSADQIQDRMKLLQGESLCKPFVPLP